MVGAVQVKRLGGWGRLWVVASAIWIAGCALMSVADWPDRDDYQLVSSTTVEADALAAPVDRQANGRKEAPTREQVEEAIVNAGKAGDSSAVRKLRALLQTLPTDATEGPWTRYAASESETAGKDRTATTGSQKQPIEVEGPDGVITEFPHGTTDATIKQVMATIYPGVPQQPPVQFDDEAFANAKSSAMWWLLALSIIPPALLALAMFAIGWIWRGFMQPKIDR